MLPIVRSSVLPTSLDRIPTIPEPADRIARAVRIGLMVYLSPVILFVALIGGLALTAELAGRLLRKPATHPRPDRLLRVSGHIGPGPRVEIKPQGAHAAR